MVVAIGAKQALFKNAHGDAKPPPILSPIKKKKKILFLGVFRECNVGCSCRGRWGLNWGVNKFNTSGAWRGGGASHVFYQVGGCWTASRGETSGIDWRYSAGRGAGLSVDGCLRGGGGGG